jgi:hypothetical protein
MKIHKPLTEIEEELKLQIRLEIEFEKIDESLQMVADVEDLKGK